MSRLRVSVCIATHNRREELARTLGKLSELDPAPDETLVVADGCTDGTATWVRAEWPRVRLIEHSQSQGSIPSRNELAATATGDILLSLDDDSHPIERDSIARLRDLFEGNGRLAVASFPQRTDEFSASLDATAFGPAHFAGSFANSGAAIRRSVFLQLGGYPGFFRHAYEEPDFALRCVAAGWQVRMETVLTIRHYFTSAQRNEIRTHHNHSRNELWSVLLHCPAPQVFAVVPFRIARQFGYAAARGLAWLVAEPRWWAAAWRGLPQCWRARRPLPWRTYLAWMRLVRKPIVAEEEWRRHFDPA